MKFTFCLGGFFTHILVDDPEKKFEAALMIEDENNNYRIILGLDKDKELENRNAPFYTRVADIKKLIEFRDALTDLIRVSQDPESSENYYPCKGR